METYKSKVYTDRPPYADFEAPRKFEATVGKVRCWRGSGEGRGGG